MNELPTTSQSDPDVIAAQAQAAAPTAGSSAQTHPSPALQAWTGKVIEATNEMATSEERRRQVARHIT